MAFDPRLAKSLPAGEYLLFEEHPGLRLVASSRFRSWIFRYKSPVTSAMRQVKIGAWPTVSYHSAVAAWERLRMRRDAGEDPADDKKSSAAERKSAAASKKQAGASYTMEMMCKDYLSEVVEKKRAKKGASDAASLLYGIPEKMRSMDPGEVHRSMAFDVINEKAKSAPTQAKILRSLLSAATEHAIDAGRIAQSAPNWWARVMQKKIRSKGRKVKGVYVGKTQRALKPKEVAELIRWLPAMKTSHVPDILTLYLWTGSRGAELVSMRGDEVSEESAGEWWWTCPVEKTKNRHREGATDHRVPLFGRALEIVKHRISLYGNDFLFPKADGGHISQDYVRTQVYYHQPDCDISPNLHRIRLTVTKWAPHDLRRTARTMLSSIKCPRDVAEAIVGHLQPGIEGVYNKYEYDTDKREWLEKLSRHLEGLIATAEQEECQTA